MRQRSHTMLGLMDVETAGYEKRLDIVNHDR
jgi:hypothetical protein